MCKSNNQAKCTFERFHNGVAARMPRIYATISSPFFNVFVAQQIALNDDVNFAATPEDEWFTQR